MPSIPRDFQLPYIAIYCHILPCLRKPEGTIQKIIDSRELDLATSWTSVFVIKMGADSWWLPSKMVIGKMMEDGDESIQIHESIQYESLEFRAYKSHLAYFQRPFCDLLQAGLPTFGPRTDLADDPKSAKICPAEQLILLLCVHIEI